MKLFNTFLIFLHLCLWPIRQRDGQNIYGVDAY